MYRLTVLYGHPEDAAEFDRYYREVHLPIARQMKGLRGWTIGKCEPADAGSTAPYYLIVGLYTETSAEMQAMLASPEGQAAVDDLPNFATGGVTLMFNEEEVLIPCRLETTPGSGEPNP
jgi:uncharacterized protein (TIGR02118 family)